MNSLLAWLEMTALSTSIRESQYVYPMLHWWHILSNTLMFGTIIFVDFRLLGWGLKRRTIEDVLDQLLPWTWAGWVLMFLSGSLIAISDPVRYYNSSLFRVKLVLIAVAGLNALVVRYHGRWRVAGAISLFAWTVVVITGRLVGYFS